MTGFVFGVLVGLVVGWLFVPAPQAVVDFWEKVKGNK